MSKFTISTDITCKLLLVHITLKFRELLNYLHQSTFLFLFICLVMLDSKESQIKVPHSLYPRIWHLMYADEFTCLDEKSVMPDLKPLEPDYLEYTILLLNPDSLGNPLEHFGDEETGMLYLVLCNINYYKQSALFFHFQ